MISLRELQLRFYDAVMGGDASGGLALLAGNGIPPACRMGVYRNNAREGFRKALAATYPVVERLAGPECFRQLAWRYARRHPSRSGNLDDFGRRFPRFLESRFGRSRFDYLPDVARLEWLCQEVLSADDRTPLDVSSLAEVDISRCAALCFSANPACRLLHSRYPVLRIWRANQPGSRDDELIDLDAGADHLLIRRGIQGVELHALATDEFTFFARVLGGGTIGAAADAALSLNPAFAIEAALLRMFQLGLVVALRVPERHAGAATSRILSLETTHAIH